MDAIPVNEFLKLLDLPALLGVAVLSIVFGRVIPDAYDRYDELIPVVLGCLLGAFAELNTPEFTLFMWLRRTIVYGAGGYLAAKVWRRWIIGSEGAPSAPPSRG